MKTITLKVTTAELGIRTATFRGRNARRLANYFADLWRGVGHTVEEVQS